MQTRTVERGAGHVVRVHADESLRPPRRRDGRAGLLQLLPGQEPGAAGEGGAVTTDDNELAARVRLLRDWGAEHKYNDVMRGFNYRLEELQLADARLPRYDVRRYMGCVTST